MNWISWILVLAGLAFLAFVAMAAIGRALGRNRLRYPEPKDRHREAGAILNGHQRDVEDRYRAASGNGKAQPPEMEDLP